MKAGSSKYCGMGFLFNLTDNVSPSGHNNYGQARLTKITKALVYYMICKFFYCTDL